MRYGLQVLVARSYFANASYLYTMKTAITQCLGFDDRLLRLIGIPVSAVLIPLVFFRGVPYTAYLLINSLLFTAAIWEGVRGIFIKASQRFPKFEQWRRRLAWIAGLSVVYVGVACIIVGFVLRRVLPDTWQANTQPETWESYMASYFMLLTMGAIYESMRFFTLWKTALLEKEQAEQARLAGQLEGLRNQVNPHFLFNSLNTLTYLIPEAPERAVRFVQQLSKVYRYVLESRDAQLIALREELNFLDAYIFLLRERFGDSLHIDLRTDALPPDTAIVPLTLQMLFENAIKHNIISADKPLHIEVFPQNGQLIVRNNLQPKKQVMHSTGVGLENIRLRYRILTGREVEVMPSAQYFAVALPLVGL